jgi:hypothetical protein
MANNSNTSSSPQYMVVARMDEEIMSRMVLVKFTTVYGQNATNATNKMKDFITRLTRLPLSKVEIQIARLHEQIVTQAASIGEAHRQIPKWLKQENSHQKTKENTNKELSLIQQKVKDLEARAPACIHRDL